MAKKKASVKKTGSGKEQQVKTSKKTSISAQHERKERILAYSITLGVFAFFALVLIVLKTTGALEGTAVTGNAVLETGDLNPGFVFAALILVSLYSVVVASYLGYRHRSSKY